VNILVAVLFIWLSFVFLKGRTHPLLTDVLAALLLQDLIALKIDLNRSFLFESSELYESLEHFDVVEYGNLVESEVDILNFDEIEDVVRHFSDEVVAEIDELERCYAANVVDFGDFIMRKVDYLQIACGCNVQGDAPNVIVAKIELADAFGRGEMRYFLDLNGVLPASSLLSGEVATHH